MVAGEKYGHGVAHAIGVQIPWDQMIRAWRDDSPNFRAADASRDERAVRRIGGMIVATMDEQEWCTHLRQLPPNLALQFCEFGQGCVGHATKSGAPAGDLLVPDVDAVLLVVSDELAERGPSTSAGEGTGGPLDRPWKVDGYGQHREPAHRARVPCGQTQGEEPTHGEP
jgi:hypothetical protein